MTEIYWRFILSTSDKKKAEKIKTSILRVMGSGEIKCFEPYWKDESSYVLEFLKKIDCSKPDDCILKCLSLSSKLSSSWFIDLPPFEHENTLDFSGVCDKNIKITGLSWMSFMLSCPG